MGIEIERKFLIDVEKLRTSTSPERIDKIEQAFIVVQPNAMVRVRITTAEEHSALVPAQRVQLGFKLGSGPVRAEFEYDIDLKTAEEFMVVYPSIKKTRYIIADETNEKRYWEVDEFHGKHKGLWVAEIELDDLDEEVELPDWITDEVTYDSKYLNCVLAQQDHIPTHKAPTVTKDVEESWNTFWKEIILNKDGSVNLDQVKCELADFQNLIDTVPMVYDHVTGGQCSKLLTNISVVNRLFDDHVNELFQDYKEDMISIIKDCTDTKEIIKILEKY